MIKRLSIKKPDPFGPSPSCCPALTLELYLLGVGGGLQTVVLGVHHGHVGAAVVQHLLHAVHAAALAACADGGAGDGVVAAQAVHLAAGRLAVLHAINTQNEIKLQTQETQSLSLMLYISSKRIKVTTCMCLYGTMENRHIVRFDGILTGCA